MPKLKGWVKGVDNVHGDNELPLDALRQAVNVDILDSGKLRQRQGHELKLAVDSGHSFWASGDDAFFVEANQLKRLNKDLTASVLGAVNTGLEPLSYQKINNEIYFSSPLVRGKVSNGVLKQWGIDVPSVAPQLSQTIGTLDAGTYHAVVTYVADDGRESGASAQERIEIPENGGIVTTSLPIPTDPAINKKRLYLTTANGEVFYMAKEVSASAQFITINTLDLVQELRTLDMSPPPLASALAYEGGRCFMVDANNPKILWYTEALSYELVNRRKNYYLFKDDITLIAGTASGRGLYVCAGDTYYLANPTVREQESITTVFGFGGFARSLAFIPTSREPIWMSERGAVIGKEGGAAQVLAASNLVPGQMDNVASMVRESNGVRQFVAVGNKTEGSTLEAGSYAEAEVIRRSN